MIGITFYGLFMGEQDNRASRRGGTLLPPKLDGTSVYLKKQLSINLKKDKLIQPQKLLLQKIYGLFMGEQDSKGMRNSMPAVSPGNLATRQKIYGLFMGEQDSKGMRNSMLAVSPGNLATRQKIYGLFMGEQDSKGVRNSMPAVFPCNLAIRQKIYGLFMGEQDSKGMCKGMPAVSHSYPTAWQRFLWVVHG